MHTANGLELSADWLSVRTLSSPSQSHWRVCYADLPLRGKQCARFDVRLDEVQYGFNSWAVLVGLADDGPVPSEGLLLDENGNRCIANVGSALCCGMHNVRDHTDESGASGGDPLKPGDVVTVRVDMRKHLCEYLCNGERVGDAAVRGGAAWPALGLALPGCGVTLLRAFAE
eukprot:TRINITY_DN1270_c0_g1_i1.p1 TRINITY_DN1270_c0_g1~~TRINITY_DN1270_c0_g1_i1.p1  ORF type:complete len:172 (+),score=40.59 TRINITY_DN1270_c0_g1_i1:385-900(+)